MPTRYALQSGYEPLIRSVHDSITQLLGLSQLDARPAVGETSPIVDAVWRQSRARRDPACPSRRARIWYAHHASRTAPGEHALRTERFFLFILDALD
jgi:hypothetical protein